MPQAIGTAASALPNPAAEIDALGPVGWWRLNDTSGSAIAKVGNNGTYFNSPSRNSGPLAIDGSSFTAARGSGGDVATNKYVGIQPQTSNVNAANPAFTMMAFCLTTDITSSANQVLFEVGGSTNGSNILITGNDDFDCMTYSTPSGTTVIQSRIRVTDYVEVNKIYHIAYGYDSAGPTTVLYINGESVGTVLNNTGAIVGSSVGANGIGATYGATRNASGVFGDANFPWRGRIGDVAYFDYLLTQSQVQRVARQMMTT